MSTPWSLEFAYSRSAYANSLSQTADVVASEDQVYTFYRQFHCNACKTGFLVPVEKSVCDIPGEHLIGPYRNQLIEAARKGRKTLWTFDSAPEVESLERETPCPNDEGHSSFIQYVRC